MMTILTSMTMLGGIRKQIHETTWNRDSYEDNHDLNYFRNFNFHGNAYKFYKNDDDLHHNYVHCNKGMHLKERFIKRTRFL